MIQVMDDFDWSDDDSELDVDLSDSDFESDGDSDWETDFSAWTDDDDEGEDDKDAKPAPPMTTTTDSAALDVEDLTVPYNTFVEYVSLMWFRQGEREREFLLRRLSFLPIEHVVHDAFQPSPAPHPLVADKPQRRLCKPTVGARPHWSRSAIGARLFSGSFVGR